MIWFIGKNINFEIIVVNNSAEKINEIPNIILIESSKNLGFGKGQNRGAKNAKGDFLWILNSDTEIIDRGFRKVVDEIKKDEKIGVIGVRILGEYSKPQSWSAGIEPTIWHLIRNNFGFSASRKIWNSLKKREVDWVSGASLLVRRELFLKIGGFDEKFFMYFEDIDLCKRVRKAGYKVIYYPDFVIRHFGGKSFKDKEIQKKYYYQSQDYYFQKYFGKFQASLLKFLRNFFAFKDIFKKLFH